MTDMLYLFLAIVLPTIAGTLFAARLNTGFGLAARLSLGFGLGMGIVSYLFLIFGFVRVPFSLAPFIAALVIVSAVLSYGLKFSTGCPSCDAVHEKGGILWKILSAILVILIIFKLAFVFFEATHRPLYSWDTWTNWSAGAKLFFYEKGLLLESSGEHFFGRGYRPFLGHPLHATFMQVWSALWLGRFDEALVKIYSFFYFLAMLALFYAAVKEEAGKKFALVSTYLLSSMPILTYHAQEGYADLPLSFYSLAAVICFWKFLTTEKKGLLVMAGTMLGFGVLTKNEGLFYVVAVGFAFIAARYGKSQSRGIFLKELACLILPVVILAGPWFIAKLAMGLGFGHGLAGSEFNWLSDPLYGSDDPRGVHWEVIGKGLREWMLTANFNLMFPVMAVSFILGIREILRSELKYLYIIIFSVMAMFIFVYLTLEVTTVMDATGIHRNTLTYAPIILFALTVLAGRLFRRSR